MLTDDEALEAIRQFQAAIDRLAIDIVIAIKPLVDHVLHARDAMIDAFAPFFERLHDDWLWAWEQHQLREGYDPGPRQAGQRALANLALAMLVRHAVRWVETEGQRDRSDPS